VDRACDKNLLNVPYEHLDIRRCCVVISQKTKFGAVNQTKNEENHPGRQTLPRKSPISEISYHPSHLSSNMLPKSLKAKADVFAISAI